MSRWGKQPRGSSPAVADSPAGYSQLHSKSRNASRLYSPSPSSSRSGSCASPASTAAADANLSQPSTLQADDSPGMPAQWVFVPKATVTSLRQRVSENSQLHSVADALLEDLRVDEERFQRCVQHLTWTKKVNDALIADRLRLLKERRLKHTFHTFREVVGDVKRSRLASRGAGHPPSPDASLERMRAAVAVQATILAELQRRLQPSSPPSPSGFEEGGRGDGENSEDGRGGEGRSGGRSVSELLENAVEQNSIASAMCDRQVSRKAELEKVERMFMDGQHRRDMQKILLAQIRMITTTQTATLDAFILKMSNWASRAHVQANQQGVVLSAAHMLDAVQGWHELRLWNQVQGLVNTIKQDRQSSDESAAGQHRAHTNNSGGEGGRGAAGFTGSTVTGRMMLSQHPDVRALDAANACMPPSMPPPPSLPAPPSMPAGDRPAVDRYTAEASSGSPAVTFEDFAAASPEFVRQPSHTPLPAESPSRASMALSFLLPAKTTWASDKVSHSVHAAVAQPGSSPYGSQYAEPLPMMPVLVEDKHSGEREREDVLGRDHIHTAPRRHPTSLHYTPASHDDGMVDGESAAALDGFLEDHESLSPGHVELLSIPQAAEAEPPASHADLALADGDQPSTTWQPRGRSHRLSAVFESDEEEAG